jgi:hypothetical protein
VTVEGRVVDVHCSPLSCLLAFEPSFNRFTAVVQAERFDAMPPDQIEQRFKGKNVRVHGTIQERDGKARDRHHRDRTRSRSGRRTAT